MFCPNCGKEIPDNSSFCEFCGSRIEDDTAADAGQYSGQDQGSNAGKLMERFANVPMIIGIVVLAIVLLTGGFYIVKAIKSGEVKSDDEPTAVNSLEASGKHGAEEDYEADKTAGEMADLENSGNNNTGDVVGAEETAATSEAVSADDEAVAAGTPDTDEYGYLIPSALADDLSTKDKSTIDDFDWFMNLVMESGMPDDAEFITDPRDVLGDWKCMVIVDPSNAEGKRSYHFCNVHIDCLIKEGIYTMSPHIEWNYEMDLSGKEIDESSKDWYLGMGEWTEGWIGNTAAAHNTKLRFYSTGDGKQYAYGGITLQGVKGTGICLVR